MLSQVFAASTCYTAINIVIHCFYWWLLSDKRKMRVSTSIILKFTVFIGFCLPPCWGVGFYLLPSGKRSKTVDFLRFKPIANSD